MGLFLYFCAGADIRTNLLQFFSFLSNVDFCQKKFYNISTT